MQKIPKEINICAVKKKDAYADAKHKTNLTCTKIYDENFAQFRK